MDAAGGPRPGVREATFQRNQPVARADRTNVLADRLGRLIAEGLAEKYASAESPARDAYRLTAKGKSLAPVLDAVVAWGLAHVPGTAAVLSPSFD